MASKAFTRDYVINITGDTSSLEKRLDEVGYRLDKLEDKKVALRVDFTQKDAVAKLKTIIGDLNKEIPGIKARFQVDTSEAETYFDALTKRAVISRFQNATNPRYGQRFLEVQSEHLDWEDRDVATEAARRVMQEYMLKLNMANNEDLALELLKQSYAFAGLISKRSRELDGAAVLKNINLDGDNDSFMDFVNKDVMSERIKQIVLAKRKEWQDYIQATGKGLKEDADFVTTTLENIQAEKQNIFKYKAPKETTEKAKEKDIGGQVHETQDHGKTGEPKQKRKRSHKKEEGDTPTDVGESINAKIDADQLVDSIREALQGRDFEVPVTPSIHWDTTNLEKVLSSPDDLEKILENEDNEQ